MSSRHERKEARIRGSGKRQVEVASFEIVNTRPLGSIKTEEDRQPALPQNENVPEPFRRNKLLEVSQKDVTPAHLIQESIYGEPEPQNDTTKRPRKPLTTKSLRNTDDEYHPTLKFSEATKRRSLSRQSRPTKIKEIPSDDDLEDSLEHDKIEYTKEFVQRRLKSSFMDRFLPNVKSDLEESPQSKIKRIAKNVEKRRRDLKPRLNTREEPKQKRKAKENDYSSIIQTEEPIYDSSISQELLRPSRSTPIYTPPVPLTKSKRKERQKPLTINFERLSHGDKRTKLNTLDVLKHFAEEFEPEDTNSTLINEPIIQEDFKLQVLHHLDYLMDIHASINDISQQISQVQKQKNEARSKIYQLRQDHTAVGHELNQLRSQYKTNQDKHEEFTAIQAQLNQLKDIGNVEPTDGGLDKHVHAELARLNKVINPHSGIYKKLNIVNQRLSTIDKQLQ